MAGFGGAVKLTGESEYKAALKQITQNLKELSSEMKMVSSQYDKSDTSTNALNAKMEVLNRTLDQQKSKLATLKAQYNAANAEMTQSTAKHDALVNKYNEEKAKLEQIGQTLGTTSSEYKQQQAVVTELAQEVKKSTTNQEANAKSMSNMRIEINRAQTDINKTTNEIEQLGNELKETGNDADELDKVGRAAQESGEKANIASRGFTVLKGALANLVSNGIQMAIGAMQSLVSEAVSSADAMNKFAQTMSFAGFDDSTIKNASARVKEYADVTVYELSDIANTTAQLAANGIQDFTGLTEAAGNLNAVAGGNADTFKSVAMMLTQTAGAGKLTTENWNQLADAIPGASGILQQAMLENGAYTGNFRDAMEKGEITADEFNQAIMEVGNKPMAVEAAKSVSTFEGAMGNLQANIVNGFMEIYNAIGNENITGFITKISDAISALVPYIVDAVKIVVDYAPQIAAAIAGIAAAFGAFKAVEMIQGVVTAFKAWRTATEGMTIAQAALNAIMSANPIGLIVAAIAGLVAAFVVLWNTSDGFRNFWIGLWENIKTIVTTVCTGIATFFTETIPNALNSMLTWFANLPSAIGGFLASVLSGVASWAQNMWSKATETGANFINAIVQFFTQLPGKIWNFLSQTIAKATQFVSDMWNKAKETGTNFLNAIVQFFTQLPGKIWSFLTQAISKAGEFVTQMTNKAKQTGTQFLSNIATLFTQLPGKIWNFLSQTISKAGQFVSQMASKAKQAASQFKNNIVNGLKSIPSQVGSIGKNIVQGLWNGISGAAGWLYSKVKGFAKGVVDSMKSALGIHSPSTVIRDEVGVNLAKGVVEGVEKEQDNTIRELKKSSKKTLEAVNASIEKEQKKFSDNLVSAAKTRVKQFENANEISLMQEVDFWKEIADSCEAGSNAYNSAISEMNKAKNELTKKVDDLNSTYVDKIEKVNTELNKNISELEKKYNDAIEQRKNAVMGQVDIFNEVKQNEALSKQAIISNLKGQVEALKDWDEVLTSLENRLGDDSASLVEKLDAQGMTSLGNLKALNSMTDDELKEYIDLWRKKEQIAQSRAEKENKELKEQTESQIKDLTAQANKQINELTDEYIKNLKELGVTVKNEGKNVGLNLTNGIEIGIKTGAGRVIDTIKQLTENMVSSIAGGLSAAPVWNGKNPFIESIKSAIPPKIDAKTVKSIGTAKDNVYSGKDSFNSMVVGFKQALSEMKVEMDDEEMGKFVDKTVTRLVYN